MLLNIGVGTNDIERVIRARLGTYKELYVLARSIEDEGIKSAVKTEARSYIVELGGVVRKEFLDPIYADYEILWKD